MGRILRQILLGALYVAFGIVPVSQPASLGLFAPDLRDRARFLEFQSLGAHDVLRLGVGFTAPNSLKWLQIRSRLQHTPSPMPRNELGPKDGLYRTAAGSPLTRGRGSKPPEHLGVHRRGRSPLTRGRGSKLRRLPQRL